MVASVANGYGKAEKASTDQDTSDISMIRFGISGARSHRDLMGPVTRLTNLSRIATVSNGMSTELFGQPHGS